MHRPTDEFLPLTHVVYHVLLSLSAEARHGYGIIQDVAKRTGGRIELEAGTLYAAIRRLHNDELLQERPAPEGTDARRRYYALTSFGREVLRAESERLEELVDLAREALILPGSPGAGA